MTDTIPVLTPLEPGLKLTVIDKKEENTEVPYQELIGSLMYIAIRTRPDHNILMNADETMPANHNFEEGLRYDIMLIMPYLNRLQNHAPKMVGGPLDHKMVGKPSLLLSNELQTLRFPNRIQGEELNAYYNIIDSRIAKIRTFASLSIHRPPSELSAVCRPTLGCAAQRLP